MNARLYDPALGRFLAPDPVVTDPSSLLDFNRYMYARNNPVRAGIVENPEEYLYSSARAFAGKDCVLDVVNMILPMDKLPLMRTLK